MGIVADGIKTTHQATHRRTCDDVYGQASLLNHFQRTDMGNALSTAATEHNGHFLALLNLVVIILRKDRQDRHHSDQKTSNLLHFSKYRLQS